MIYDERPNSWCDGQWHCPFSPEWVERMRHAAKICEPLTVEQIEAAYIRIERNDYYELPPSDFISEPQDARGIPLSLIDCRCPNVTCDVYDYDSIPVVVITNGHDDWPLKIWEPKQQTI